MTDAEVVAQLAEVLREWRGPETAVSNAFLANRLLPVVREIADQRAVEAARLRETVEALAEAWAHHHRADDVRWAGQQLRRALAGTDE